MGLDEAMRKASDDPNRALDDIHIDGVSIDWDVQVLRGWPKKVRFVHPVDLFHSLVLKIGHSHVHHQLPTLCCELAVGDFGRKGITEQSSRKPATTQEGPQSATKNTLPSTRDTTELTKCARRRRSRQQQFRAK
eukprot:c9580_g1_i4.p1 GENE.c9580_g1_i4~~c9580_g1_i4.p1  ORF type:complete len:134 (-),score=15.40 c9580_g1_i4:168-569(-)